VYSEGLVREGQAPIALLSHISAMLCGAVYIAVFRKEKLSEIFTK